MKPLLTVPLTDEDWQIQTRDVGRGGFKISFYSGRRFALYRESDRRDAALMFRAQCNRWVAIHPEGYLYDSDPPCLAPMRQECGPTGGALNITPCA